MRSGLRKRSKRRSYCERIDVGDAHRVGDERAGRRAATGRVLLVQEAPLTGGFASEIAARIAGSDAIYSLLAPIKRLCGLDAPIRMHPNSRRPVCRNRRHHHCRTRSGEDKLMREVPLVMPKMSMTMTEGTFLVWHRKQGDAIQAGDLVCEVASDKVDMEVESPIEGTLARLVAEPDQVLAVGEPLAFIMSAMPTTCWKVCSMTPRQRRPQTTPSRNPRPRPRRWRWHRRRRGADHALPCPSPAAEPASCT